MAPVAMTRCFSLQPITRQISLRSATWIAARARLPLRLSIAMYLQAFAANLVSVGLRLIPIGQTEGQAIVRDLAPRYGAIAAACLDGNLDDIGGFTVAAEIASMQHETLYSRVFRT